MGYRKDAEQFILSIEGLYDPSHHANDLNLILGLIKDREHTGQEFVEAMPGLKAAGDALSLNLGLILCDAAVCLASVAIMHRVLKDALQAEASGAIEQSKAHKLVDLLCQVEGARALYFDLIGALSDGSLAAGPGASLAKLEVLAQGLESALGDIARALVHAVGAGATAPMIDYCQALLAGEEMLKLSGALDRNIDDLAV